MELKIMPFDMKPRPVNNNVKTKLEKLYKDNERLKKARDELQSKRVINEDRIRYLEDCQDTLENRAVAAERKAQELENQLTSLKHQFETNVIELEKLRKEQRMMETRLLEKEKLLAAKEHEEKPLWNEQDKIVIKSEPLDTSMSDDKDDEELNQDNSCKFPMYDCAKRSINKRRRLHSNKYRQRSYKKTNNSHETSRKMNSFELYPITINIDDSSNDAPGEFSGNSVKSELPPGEKFIEAISTMRMLDLSNFGFEEIKFAEDRLYQTMKDLAKNGNGDFLNEIILNYVFSRQMEVSLKTEKQSNFAFSEKCIAASYTKLVSIGQAKIVTNLILSFYNIVKRRLRFTLYGYASGVMLLAAISKNILEHRNIRTLCCEIVVSHKNISHYLLALIYKVYPNAVYHADAKDNWMWFQAVMEVIFSEKPENMPFDEWQDICAVYENVPKLTNLSYESPEQLLEMIMTDIKNYSDSSYEIICQKFGYALLMLGVHCGKDWFENVLIKHLSLYKKTNSRKLGEGISTMFSSVEGRLKTLLK